MIKYGTCDRCEAVCETLHEDIRGRWVCARHRGFVFCADNGEWYAVNADGEQSPSFRNRGEASTYLDAGSAAVWLVVTFPLVAMIVWFVAATAGLIAGATR